MQDSARAIDYLNSPIHEGDDGLRELAGTIRKRAAHVRERASRA